MAKGDTTLHRYGDSDRCKLGNECLKLHKEHGLNWATIAKRKGVAFNTVRRWVRDAQMLKT